MRLSLQTFTSLVQNMAASVQASASQLVDLTVGSTLRAVLEANASIGLWMQWLIVQVLQTTRAATSTGADLDSWIADFSFTRLPAASSSGTVTFSRYTATTQAAIPVGALIRTVDGIQTFGVTASAGHAAFVALTNSYVLPAGIASLDVPVKALTPGARGNVLAGTITLLATAIVGIDTVTNGAALQNGLDAESDASVRTRFQTFIDTRSRATPDAVRFAVASVQQGLSCTLRENIDSSGAPRPGSFIVTVDDGSGTPSAALLESVRQVVEAVRPVGSIFTLRGPSVKRADVSATLSVGSGLATSALTSAVAASLTHFVESLPLGTSLSLSKLASVAYAASASITNVYGVTINGIAADVAGEPSSVIKPGTIAVN